jgi:hypothetical protein
MIPMKAQQRHELHQNALATYLGKSYEKAKSGSSVLWGGLLLVVAIAIAYWWWTAVAADRATDAWTSYYNNRDSVDGLEQMAPRLKGSAAEKAAQLTMADQLYDDGYRQLFQKSPKSAMEKFNKAFTIYEELSQKAGTTEIGLRATIGAAKCQESIGEVARAIYFYEDVVTRFDKTFRSPTGEQQQHPLVADAQRRAKLLKDSDGLAFYGEGGRRWPNRLPTIEHEVPKAPPIPSGALDTKPSGP